MASSVGTLNEKPLHAALKHWIARPGDAIEAPLEGFVVDVLRDDLVIEIQTGGFSSIAKKLRALVQSHPVHLVHPIATQRWIRRTGRVRGPARRKSPKRGAPCDIFVPLVSLPDLLGVDNFSLEVVFTHEEEVRERAPTRRGRRTRRHGGWAVVERRLLKVVGSQELRGPSDLAELLPTGLPEPFDTADLAVGFGRPRWFAQKAAYCLAHAGVVREVGRRGNARLYARSEPS